MAILTFLRLCLTFLGVLYVFFFLFFAPPRRLQMNPSVIYRANPDRHAPKDEVEGRLLLDVVIAQGTTILELFAGEDEALLIWRNASFLFLKKK